MNKNKTDELPEGWVIEQLEQFTNRITKGATPTTYGFSFLTKGINFIKVENLSDGILDLGSVKDFISEEAHNFQTKSKLEENDLLFSIAGTIGKTCIVRKDYLPANTNQALAIIKGFTNCIIPKLLKFQLDSFITHKTKAKARGGAMNNISLDDLKSLEVFIPPFPEQYAIVSKIEQLFSELDKGVESLKTAQQQLKVYRQSVLKSAFEGKLTEQWRQNQDLPDAQALLEKIQKAREEKAKASGKKQKIVAPLTKKELDILPELPKGWGWVKFGEVVDEFIRGPFGSALKKEFFVEHGYKVYEQQNAIYKTIEFGRYFISDEKFQELRRFETKHDDYIVSCSGTIGKLYKLPINAPKGLINQALLIIRIRRAILLDKYFSFLFTSNQFQRLIIKDAKGTAMLNLAGVKELELVPFPICSLPEQHQIVQEIESRLSECDNMEATIATSLQQAEALRQSILKKAFEGKLLNEKELEAIRQDPTWEPAERLLERIRAEKAVLYSGKKGRKSKAGVK